MSTTTATWFNAMTMRVATLDKGAARSIDWEQAMQTLQLHAVCFAYHRDEYLRFQQEGISSRSPPEGDTSFIVAPITQPPGVKLSMNAALAVAQLLAAAQSLRATCDCLFRVAYRAHNLRSPSQPECTSSRESVQSSLTGALHGRSKYEYERLTASMAYRFLDGFVQVAARQNVITARRKKIGQPNLRRLELLIREFEVDSDWQQCTFPSRWANDFLFTDCEAIIESCNLFGKAIASEMV